MYLFSILLLSLCQIIDGFEEKWENEYSQIPEISHMTPFPLEDPLYLEGDFFGDGIKDYVFQARDTNGTVKIIFIDEGENQNIHILGRSEDPFQIEDYIWARVFQLIPSGEVLWSNFTDEYRPYEQVPDKEKVKLDYDAIFIHNEGSCGGGFVYWQNGRFNWLQQE